MSDLLRSFELKKVKMIDELNENAAKLRESAAETYLKTLKDIDDALTKSFDDLDEEHKNVLAEHIKLSDAALVPKELETKEDKAKTAKKAKSKVV